MNAELLNKLRRLANMAAHLPYDVTLEDEDAAMQALHAELAADTVLDLIALAEHSLSAQDEVLTEAVGGDVLEQAKADLARVYNAFGFGLHQESRKIGVLMTNIENVIRFANMLHAIEREFFMVPGEPDEDYPDDEPDDICMMNCWGSTEAEYVEQFRGALAVKAKEACAEERRSWDMTCSEQAMEIEYLKEQQAAAAPSPAVAGGLTKPTLIAYCATDLDGRYDVGTTPEQAKERAGHGCDTVFPIYDIGENATPSPSLAVRDVVDAAPAPIHETIVQQNDEMVCTACGTTAALAQAFNDGAIEGRIHQRGIDAARIDAAESRLAEIQRGVEGLVSWETDRGCEVYHAEEVDKIRALLTQQGQASTCEHNIVSAVNQIIKSGMLCTKCGKLFKDDGTPIVSDTRGLPG